MPTSRGLLRNNSIEAIREWHERGHSGKHQPGHECQTSFLLAEVERLRAAFDTLEAAFDTLDQRHSNLLDDIERWNATIAIGRDRADQMEDVIRAAQNLDAHRDEGHAALVSYLIRLHDALAQYETTRTPLPKPFARAKE